MRKFLVLLLSFFFTVPVFAEPSAEFILKLGAAPSSQVNSEANGSSKNFEADPGYSISPEAYFYFNDYLGIGIGYNQMFNRYVKDKGDLNTSNFYFAFRPKLKVLEKEYVYLIGQIGYGLMNHNFNVNYENLDGAGGIYYGLGGGVDVRNFIFELLFTSNKATFKSEESSYEEDDEYTMMTINVGYRFSLSIKPKQDKAVEMPEEEDEE